MGLIKKIGRGIKKVARKVIPKEISGIMQVAAPFVAAGPAGIPGALALSLGGQLRSGRGRISPLKTLLAIAPSRTFRDFYSGYDVNIPFSGGRTFSLGDNRLTDAGLKLDEFLYGYDSATKGDIQGILGTGGKGLSVKGLLEGSIFTPDGKNISKPRVAAAVVAGLTLTQTQQQIEEEGEKEGLEPSEIARLQQEAAEMW